MIDSSGIISRAFSANRLATPSADDTNVTIPPVIVPVAEPFDVTRRASGALGAAVVWSQSFINPLTLVVQAGAALQGTVGFLTAGLWRITIDALYSSNYAQAFSALGASINVADAAASFRLMSFHNPVAAGCAIPKNMVFRIHVPEEFLDVEVFLANNAAGEKHQLLATIVGEKLT